MLIKTFFITPEGQKKLEEELEYLQTVKRKEVARQLHESLDEGDDIDDNAAYEVAKNELAFLEGRIREIEEKLARSRLVGPYMPNGLVQIGSTIIIRDSDDLESMYSIVEPTESNPREGLISYESPLGQALLGHKPGEDVVVNAPIGILS
ncbi:MAG: GreA/GreB family elongation factor [Candidatus Hermodarchaeia archaeon]|jgi:transcription elongation factor GreA